ncbi:MAG: hypothetical protein E6Q99_07270 [Elusimicrobia bacterium]|jgi:hypothetical protein|nr:MAG: hypothetical protein E6Q99_07270 [Elusimicrobiota bacterium]
MMTHTRTSIGARGIVRLPPGFWAVAALLFLSGGRAFGLSLNPDTGVSPKVFTPNADTINDTVCFQIDNPGLAELRGVVTDVSGADVAELRPASPVCAPPHDVYDLMWDGKDRAGRTVPPGAYVYRIEGEGAMFTGVVVVAK